MLLGVRYVVCDKGRETVKDYIKVAEGNRFVIFKNPWALQNTYYLRQGKTFSLQNRNPMVVQNRILREMGMDKLYDIQTVQAEQGTLNPLGKSIFKVSLQQGEHAYLYLGAIEPDMVTIDGKVYRRDDTNTFFVDLGYAKQTKTITVRTDRRIVNAVLGIYPEKQLEQIYRKLSERQFHIAQGENTVSAESEGVLFLNSFYDENQVIKIDGKEQKVMDMGGFIGIPVKAGKHSVEIRYCVPGLFWGILISFFSCMAWIKIVVLRAFRLDFVMYPEYHI